MFLLAQVLRPFVYIYVAVFKYRLRRFGYDIKYKYLPSAIDHAFLPIHMDPFWIPRGFYGLNKCLVPRGNPYSKRFDYNNPYFQTWIGTYYLTQFRKRHFSNDLEKIRYLSEASIADQNIWMRTYGVKKTHTRLIDNSVVKVGEYFHHGYRREVYYGEMMSDVEDYHSRKYDWRLMHYLSALAAQVYSGHKVDLRLLQKDPIRSPKATTRLFGYYSLIELDHRYLITYVCGDMSHRDEVNDELYKVIKQLGVIKF